MVIDNLSMRFDLPNGGSVQALKDVSLNLAEGRAAERAGPSGCGKTTLLNIVAGFLAPTDGQVDAQRSQKVTGPDAERGMVFQQGALFEWMSVRDNISLRPRMAGAGIGNHGPIMSTPARRRAAGFQGKGRSTSCPAACSSVWRWRAALPTTPT
jgi:taurine transport system ATP-binding protein